MTSNDVSVAMGRGSNRAKIIQPLAADGSR